MATIINTIQTQFTSRGARGVQQDTENVGRAQTRMGQASASAGRSFAAQSQGLGGLVGAYAGAAATVFALEAAFTALSRAAQAETIVIGTNALASGIAQSGPKIIKSIQDITQGQLTMAEAAQNANIGLSAGFDSTQIEGLTKVAMGASRALGRNLTDSLQRVFRGVAKLEPELLDELGIFVRIEPAVTAYARELGVAASSLTQFERGQAFANAAIEEGIRKFGMIDVSAPSAQKSLEQLNTQVQELAIEFGQFVTAILLPFVNFLKNDAGNALVLFGGIILLVFSKALTMIGAFASGGLTKFTLFADGLIAKTASMRLAIESLTAATTAYKAAQGSLGVTASSRNVTQAQLTGAGFRSDTIMGTGRYDSRAARKPGMAADRDTTKAASDARTKFNAGTLRTKQSQDAAIASLQKMNLVLKENSIAFQQNTTMINALTAAQGRMSVAAVRATQTLTVLKTVITGIGSLLGLMMSIFSGVFLVLSAFDLAGFNVFGKIKDMFVDSTQATQNYESAITGAYTAIAGGADKLTSSLRAIGASDEELESVSERIVNIQRSFAGQTEQANRDREAEIVARMGREEGAPRVTSDISEVLKTAFTPNNLQTFAGMSDTDSFLSSDVMGERMERFQGALEAGDILEANTALITLTKTLEGVSTAYALSSEKGEENVFSKSIVEGVRRLEQELGVLKDVVDDVGGAITESDTVASRLAAAIKEVDDAGEGATYTQRELVEILKIANDVYGKMDVALIPLIGRIGRLTGLRMDTLADMFTTNGNNIADGFDTSSKSVNLFGFEVERVKGKLNFDSLKEFQKDLVLSAITVTNALDEADRAYAAGATNADKLSAVIAGATNQFLSGKDAIQKYAKDIMEASDGTKDIKTATEEAVKFFEELKIRVQGLISQRDGLKKIEAVFKGIKKTFGGGSLEGITFSGLVALEKGQVKIAESSKLMAQASDEVLLSILDQEGIYFSAAKEMKTYGDMLKLVQKPNPTNQEQQQIAALAEPSQDTIKNAEVYNLAVGSAADKVLKTGVALRDNLAKEAKMKLVLDKQLEVREAQIQVMKQQGLLAEETMKQRVIEMTAQNTLAANTVSLETKKLTFTRAESALQYSIARNTAKAAVSSAANTKSLKANHLLKLAELKNSRQLMAQEQELLSMKESASASPEAIKAKELEIIKLQRFQAIFMYDMRIKAIKAEASANAATVQAEKDNIRLKMDFLKKQVIHDKATKNDDGTLTFTAKGDFLELQELERTMFVNKQNAEKAKVTHEKAMATIQEQILKDQKTLQTTQRALDDLNRTQQRAAQDAQRENMITFLTGVDAFSGAVKQMATVVAQQMGAEGKQLSTMAVTTTEAEAAIQKILDEAGDVKSSISQQRADQDAKRTKTVDGITAIEDDIIDKKITQAELILTQATNKLNAIDQNQADALKNFDGNQQEALLGKIREIRLLQLELDKVENQQGAEGTAIKYQIIEATEALNNELKGLDIQASNTAKALGKFDTDMGAIKNTLDTELIDGFQYLGDVLLGVNEDTKSFATAIENTFKQLMRSLIQEIQMQMITKPLAGMASSFITGALTGGTPVGGFFGGAKALGGGSGTVFDFAPQGLGMGKAAGGVVHMSQGGQVNALRDRVPAMLEPGEFVIRKNSAKSIGRNKLGQMNATGASGMGNVEFNIVNQGSPKQAEQQGMPKFDTDKLVIDVVMRDLENNGPIRKALRS